MTADAEFRQSWWRRRLLAPILAQLRQGTTPRLMALSIAAGVVLGLFPILGATTILCALAALAFGLNQPVIQTVNYLIAPLQLLLLFPLYRAGEKLFQQTPVPLFSITELNTRFWAAPGQFFIDYGLVALYGIAVWALLAPPLLLLLYAALRLPLQRLAQRMQARRVALG